MELAAEGKPLTARIFYAICVEGYSLPSYNPHSTFQISKKLRENKLAFGLPQKQNKEGQSCV